MHRRDFLIRTLAVSGIAATPVVFALPQEHRDSEHGDAQHGKEEKAPDYHFRDEDKQKLHTNYRNVQKVNVNNRPQYVRGGHLPSDWRRRLHPVPAAVIRELPPPPPGYVFGYFDGYAVCYNPTTLLIGDVIDVANL